MPRDPRGRGESDSLRRPLALAAVAVARSRREHVAQGLRRRRDRRERAAIQREPRRHRRAAQERAEKEYLSLDGSFFSAEMQSLLKQRVPVIANVAVILFVAGVALDALAEVFQPFLMALLVYFILKPIAIWLYARTPLGMGLSYFFAVIGFIVVVGLVFVAAIWNIQSWASDEAARSELTRNFESIVTWANDRGVINVSEYNSLDRIITPAMQANFIGAAGGAVFSTLTMILFLAFIISPIIIFIFNIFIIIFVWKLYNDLKRCCSTQLFIYKFHTFINFSIFTKIIYKTIFNF